MSFFGGVKKLFGDLRVADFVVFLIYFGAGGFIIERGELYDHWMDEYIGIGLMGFSVLKQIMRGAGSRPAGVSDCVLALFGVSVILVGLAVY